MTLENNTTAAIQILKIVQQQLQFIFSDFLTPLKEAVYQNITVLSAIPQIDFIEISERLDYLKNQKISSLLIYLHRSVAQLQAIPNSKQITQWKKSNIILAKLCVVFL